jgi:hypothetical protein
MWIRRHVSRTLRSPWLALVNVLLCIAAVAANRQFQFFCRPVPWAAVVLVLAITPLAIYPLVGEKLGRAQGVVFFLFGIAACICIYCIVFIGPLHRFFLLFSLPFIPFLPPYFFLGQVLFHLFSAHGRGTGRKAFALGVGLCVATVAGAAVWFNRSHAAVEAAIEDPARNASKVVPSYMTERMLGMHFKYHMSLCFFDGWRPPLHDPLLVSAAWLNYAFMDTPSARSFRSSFFHGGQGSPFNSMSPLNLRGRIAAYHAVFPGKPLKEDCACAQQYSEQYRKATFGFPDATR